MQADSRTATTVYLLCAALLAGCGGESRVAEVRGVVTLDGTPVGEASVAFTPRAGGRPAYGITKSDGTFELTTYQQNDGALIGTHRVTITALDTVMSDKDKALEEEYGSLAGAMRKSPPKQRWRVPQVYSSHETSGLGFEVKRGVSNNAEFALEE